MTFTESLEALADALKDAMVDELHANGSYDTGRLAESITYDIRKQGSTYQLVRTMLTYGVYVDQGDGRKPGKMPPVRPLMDWIKQKKISVPRGLTTESFAFAIANKIAKKGTNPRPKPFIQPAINKVLGTDAQQLLSKGTEQEITDAINQRLQDIKIQA